MIMSSELGIAGRGVGCRAVLSPAILEKGKTSSILLFFFMHSGSSFTFKVLVFIIGKLQYVPFQMNYEL